LQMTLTSKGDNTQLRKCVLRPPKDIEYAGMRVQLL